MYHSAWPKANTNQKRHERSKPFGNVWFMKITDKLLPGMSNRSLPFMVPQGEVAQFIWQYYQDTPHVVPTPCSNTLYINVPFAELNYFPEKRIRTHTSLARCYSTSDSFSLVHECDDHEEWEYNFSEACWLELQATDAEIFRPWCLKCCPSKWRRRP